MHLQGALFYGLLFSLEMCPSNVFPFPNFIFLDRKAVLGGLLQFSAEMVLCKVLKGSLPVEESGAVWLEDLII